MIETIEQFEKRIQKECPYLYEDLYSENYMETCMTWGLEGIGPGWIPLIEEASLAIEKVIQEMIKNGECREGHPKAVQIKEKFGGLRLYMNYETDEISKIINIAEDKSYKTCIKCGDSGEERSGGWITVLCDNCYNRGKNEI